MNTTKSTIILCAAFGFCVSLGVATGIDMCNKVWRKRITEVLDEYRAPKRYGYDPLEMKHVSISF